MFARVFAFAIGLPLLSYCQSGPSLDETTGFIVEKVSGKASPEMKYARQQDGCDGTLSIQYSYELSSPQSCSLQVRAVKHQLQVSMGDTCTLDFRVSEFLQAKLVDTTFAYSFRLDFQSVSLPTIRSQESPTPPGTTLLSQPFYSVHMELNSPLTVSTHKERTGYASTERSRSESNDYDETWQEENFMVGDREMTERLVRAFQHAAELCGAKKEPF